MKKLKNTESAQLWPAHRWRDSSFACGLKNFPPPPSPRRHNPSKNPPGFDISACQYKSIGCNWCLAVKVCVWVCVWYVFFLFFFCVCVFVCVCVCVRRCVCVIDYNMRLWQIQANKSPAIKAENSNNIFFWQNGLSSLEAWKCFFFNSVDSMTVSQWGFFIFLFGRLDFLVVFSTLHHTQDFTFVRTGSEREGK